MLALLLLANSCRLPGLESGNDTCVSDCEGHLQAQHLWGKTKLWVPSSEAKQRCCVMRRQTVRFMEGPKRFDCTRQRVKQRTEPRNTGRIAVLLSKLKMSISRVKSSQEYCMKNKTVCFHLTVFSLKCCGSFLLLN